MILWIAKIVGVVAALTAAAVLTTDASRLPPALRGLARTLARDAGRAPDASSRPRGLPLGRRLVALALVLLAFGIVVA